MGKIAEYSASYFGWASWLEHQSYVIIVGIPSYREERVTFLQDFRYSLRQLVKNPGFALTAILSLALGIGATVSVFSVIYGVLLHPFPYANVDRMANLSIRDSRGNLSDAFFTGPQLRDLRKVHAFESFATWRPENPHVTGQQIPE
ncbi:MAG TPA: hypothetical protein VK638_30230, partial [Edaphobacter sp.]|nr:hypothetical protein [Edaphobacter sp.]